MTTPRPPAFAEFPDIALNLFRSLATGRKVIRSQNSSFTSRRSRDAETFLIQGGFAAPCATPRGRKTWLELGEKGRPLIPALRAYDAALAIERKANERQLVRNERIYHAGRRLYDALTAVIANTPGSLPLAIALLREINQDNPK